MMSEWDCCRLLGRRSRTLKPPKCRPEGACSSISAGNVAEDLEGVPLGKSAGETLPPEPSSAPKEREDPAPHPVDNAGCLATVTVSWLWPLIRLANRRPLEEKDVWAAPASLDPEALAASFWVAWKREMEASKPRVERALARAFWRDFWLPGLMLFAFACCSLVQPFLIGRLLDYLRGGPGYDTGFGIGIAFAMLGCSAMSSFLVTNYSRASREGGIRIKTALMCAVFQRSMEMSSAARLVGSVGQTTNLMSVDAEKLYLASNFMHFTWMAPLMALAVGLLLISVVGVSALLGLALIISLWPMQVALARVGGLAGKRGMGFTDERVKFATEVVRGIRAVKLCAWEEPVFERASRTREKEVSWLGLGLFLKAITREGILVLLPPATLAVMFALERGRGVTVDETAALTALGLLNTLRFPFNLFAGAMAQCQDALVACGRIGEFMRRPVRPVQERRQIDVPVVTANGARFTWGMTDQHGRHSAFELSVPSLQLAGKAKIAVVGRVAAGKSSLLAALLGEMRLLEGHCELQGRVGYMGQTPWIQNASLRDNILFGHPWDEAQYWRAVEGAALPADLQVLVDGDLTEIGERGINLSGGQKARVGVARCMYAAAAHGINLIMLDCPFDALDVPTGVRVFQGLAEMGGNALLICSMSAQVHLLPYFDAVVVVDEGQVCGAGSLADVAARFPDLVKEGAAAAFGGVVADARSPSGPAAAEQSPAARSGASPRRPGFGAGSSTPLSRKDTNKKGSVSFRMMLAHIGGAAAGGPGAGLAIALAVLVVFLAGQACRVASDVTITGWASDAVGPEVAFGLLAACAALLALRIAVVVVVSKRASVTLHCRTFWHMLNAPVVEYFDVTTSGEIINKFAKDMETSDVVLPESCMQFISNSSQLAMIIALSAYAIPWFLAILAALGIVFILIARQFSAVSRDLKRLDGSTRSPVYNIFSEALGGLETIRAWGAQGRFLAEFARRARHNLTFFYAVSQSEAWVMGRLESISFTIIGAFAFSAVGMRGQVEPRLAGLALVYSIQLTAMLQRTVQLAIMINQQMTSCERVLSFQSIVQEPPRALPSDGSLPQGWPFGAVAFEGVELRYRGGEPALQGVSFCARPGERVGVCGRTGAGKSSLISALFRLVDLTAGRICIDGFDISSIGLKKLRSSLSIIPQEPVIFSGTLRSTLDPFGTAPSDSALEDVLHRVGLSGLLAPGQGGLDASVAEHGENLSQGQRQLLCVARAMVRRSRITALDEATSSMDMETDRAVQRALEQHWRAGGGTTLLTIAHRLSTILEYDRILVLSFGRVVEFDTPATLRARPQGALAEMLREGVGPPA